MRYLYKHIEIFQYYGSWQANYNDGERCFSLHRECCRTKKEAYALAKEEVDYLNGKAVIV